MLRAVETQVTKKARKRAKRKAVAKVKKTCRMVTRKVRGKKKRVKVCTPVKAKKKTTTAARKPATIGQQAPAARVTAPAAPPAASNAPVPIFAKSTSEAAMERLLWRAGFGPRPGQAAQWATGSLEGAVQSLTRPSGPAALIGPEPTDENGRPLAPADAWGHDHLWWLDRMVRSDQPLVERMALIWHDWFATSHDGVNSQQQMLDQIELFRAKGLGSFDELFTAVTADPAMLQWLNGTSNTRWAPNENYAREMMELFSLGADRGAYTETDVREMARALTGFRSDWSAELGSYNFRFDPARHDTGLKTIFGQTGAFGWQDGVRLCVEHPLHAAFFTTKLWSYFVPVAPDDATLASLQGIYLGSGRQIRPVVEAILQHPAFYGGPDMVIPPVVYTAGLLRAVGRGIDTTAWAWLASYTGQRLFYPPNVAGWDDTRWLDTSTIRGRWMTANHALLKISVNPWSASGLTYDTTEDPATAVTRAMAALGNPSLSAETQKVIADFAVSSVSPTAPSWFRGPHRAMRQNALRMLIATSPDLQVC
ncbi:MAG TPA: DUF1800 domain-containing protein [Baekduia sp.]|nr:DUF1800 domain-containing protein [Baekduia sp.]